MNWKLLAVVVLLVSVTSVSWATPVAWIKNKHGGKIVLHDTRCRIKSLQQKLDDPKNLYTFNAEGDTINGCWTYEDGLIHILWDDDDHTEKRYPRKLFQTPRPEEVTYR